MFDPSCHQHDQSHWNSRVKTWMTALTWKAGHLTTFKLCLTRFPSNRQTVWVKVLKWQAEGIRQKVRTKNWPESPRTCHIHTHTHTHTHTHRQHANNLHFLHDFLNLSSVKSWRKNQSLRRSIMINKINDLIQWSTQCKQCVGVYPHVTWQ